MGELRPCRVPCIRRLRTKPFGPTNGKDDVRRQGDLYRLRVVVRVILCVDGRQSESPIESACDPDPLPGQARPHDFVSRAPIAKVAHNAVRAIAEAASRPPRAQASERYVRSRLANGSRYILW
jgi:hypothetical protein